MASIDSSKAPGLSVEVITEPSDLAAFFDCQARSFGKGIQDYAWMTLFPGWDTESGRQAHIKGLEARFQSTTKDGRGRPNSVFLKATMPSPNDPSSRAMAGTAIWEQFSFVDGHGNQPTDDARKALDLNLYPEQADRDFMTQLFKSMFSHKVKVAHEKAQADPPAIFALDVCAVDPDFWRRGIANQLVQWGLDEAHRRGGLECTTEASAMGRFVYQKLGFKPMYEIEYHVDDEQKKASLPSNLFMRTQAS